VAFRRHWAQPYLLTQDYKVLIYLSYYTTVQSDDSCCLGKDRKTIVAISVCHHTKVALIAVRMVYSLTLATDHGFSGDP
jgi:hypothetical protein